MAQTTWEYDINHFRVLAMTDLTTAHHLDDFNIRGAEGWELCGFTMSSARSNDAQTNETLITCVWKRRKTGEPTARGRTMARSALTNTLIGICV